MILPWQPFDWSKVVYCMLVFLVPSMDSRLQEINIYITPSSVTTNKKAYLLLWETLPQNYKTGIQTHNTTTRGTQFTPHNGMGRSTLMLKVQATVVRASGSRGGAHERATNSSLHKVRHQQQYRNAGHTHTQSNTTKLHTKNNKRKQSLATFSGHKLKLYIKNDKEKKQALFFSFSLFLFYHLNALAFFS